MGSQVSKPFLQAASTLAAAALREKAAVGIEEVATTWDDLTRHQTSWEIWRFWDLTWFVGKIVDWMMDDGFYGFLNGLDGMFDGFYLEFHGF